MRRLTLLTAILTLLAATVVPAAARGDAARQATDTLNSLRRQAGQPTVALRPDHHGIGELAEHLVATDVLTHEPTGLSAAATAAAGRSVLHGASRTDVDVADLVDELVAAPFHRFELLHPTLQAVTVGAATDDRGDLRAALAIDTRTHRHAGRSGVWAWPADGQHVPDGRWDGREWPPPSTHCPARRPVGTAISLSRTRNVPVTDVTVTVAGHPVDVCTMTSNRYSHDDPDTAARASSLLDAHAAVIVLPHDPLPAGPVDVAVTDTAATYTWTFIHQPGTTRPATGQPTVTPTAGTTIPTNADDVTIGEAAGTSAADRLLVCRDDVPVDCLAAAGMARPGDRLLLVTPDGMSRRDLQAAARWSDHDTDLVVLGGPQAVPVAAVARLEDATGTTAVRWWGNDRYGTAAAVVSAHRPDTVVVSRSDVPVDALTSGRAGMVLLAAGDHLPAATVDALAAADPDTVLVAGGPQAVPASVVDQLRRHGHDPVRVAGPDRTVTAGRFADRTDAPWAVTVDLARAPWQQVLPLSVLAASYDAAVVHGPGIRFTPAG